VLQTLGIEQMHRDAHFAEWDDFSISQAGEEKPLLARANSQSTRHAVRRGRRIAQKKAW
jgi:hypothetical protein